MKLRWRGSIRCGAGGASGAVEEGSGEASCDREYLAAAGYPSASYRLRLYSVVLGVRPDEFYQNPSIGVGNMHHDTVSVAGNIEDQAIVGEKIDRGTEQRVDDLRRLR